MSQARLFRSSDALLAAFLIATTAMLLVPLPTMVLDLLLVLNISFSMLLLLAGLYMPNALALLSFPSILLLTTLFRLGLNVASTRLILSQGDAGTVIQSFGTFLIRGEIVVGLIIFLILTVVNFIVVARGAARVSEVAARFALDALPGKQMAIDSDLRSGLMNASEAQRRREELRKESQLYGSMDGAMKFVQGDAIAGLFIIATNIIGGMYLGLRSGLSFGEAVDTYTILTVGDGLVHQIPAILISICAGIVVTRVSSGEGASLGSDLQAQVFTRPGALLFCGVLLLMVAATPGLPGLPFSLVGLLLLSLGAWQWKKGYDPEVIYGLGTGSGARLSLPTSSSGIALPTPGMEEISETESSALLIQLDHTGLFPLYSADRTRFARWWQSLEADLYAETGLTLPRSRVVSDPLGSFGQYSVKVRGSIVLEGQVPCHAVLVEMNPINAGIFGLDIIAETEHPFGGERVFWTSYDEVRLRVLESAGVSFFLPVEYIGISIAEFFIRAPEEILSVAEVLEMETGLEEKYPGLISRTLNREFLGASRLAEILQELVRQGVGIRDTKQIVEALTSYCSSIDPQRIQDSDFRLDEAVGFVRQARRRHLMGRYLTSRRTLKVITLSEAVDAVFEQLPATPAHASLPLPAVKSMELSRALKEILTPLRTRGVGAAVVLCREDVMSTAIRFLRQSRVKIPVVTFEELDPLVPLEQVGCWEVADREAAA